MPQLWTETFVSQYFWLLAILFTFYYFIATKVIPNIADAIKARQVTDKQENTAKNVNFINDKSTNLFNLISKQDSSTKLTSSNWEVIQSEWLLTNPENDNSYWTNTTLAQDNQQILSAEENEELTLEEFLQIEDK